MQWFNIHDYELIKINYYVLLCIVGVWNTQIIIIIIAMILIFMILYIVNAIYVDDVLVSVNYYVFYVLLSVNYIQIITSHYSN